MTISPIHQQLYVKFLYGSIHKKIKKDPLKIFIKANAKKEEAFREFVEKNYKNFPITDPNFSIRGILSDVLKIVKTRLTSVMSYGDQYLEKHYQSNAYREQIRRGELGKALTYRQANGFLLLADCIEIPPSKLTTPLPPLTPKEKLYLSFIKESLELSQEANCTATVLGATEKMQKDFIKYAKQRKVIYTLKDLNLIGVINTLTFRAQMETDPMHFRDEAKWQQAADNGLQKYKSRGFTGRTLTPRQVKVLINYSKGQ